MASDDPIGFGMGFIGGGACMCVIGGNIDIEPGSRKPILGRILPRKCIIAWLGLGWGCIMD